VTSETRTDTNDAYAFPAIAATSRDYAVNGLNQYASVASNAYSYDANGNLTSDGGNAYTYDIENRLVKAVAGSTTTNLLYDPLGRLVKLDQGTGTSTRRLPYDGEAMVAEYNASDYVQTRYVHGSNANADDGAVRLTAPFGSFSDSLKTTLSGRSRDCLQATPFWTDKSDLARHFAQNWHRGGATG
jgi:hypothetical protein